MTIGIAADAPPTLLGHAIGALSRRWRLPPEVAAAALVEVAEELGLEIGDLAALVLAAAQQQRAQGGSVAVVRPAPGQERSSSVVADVADVTDAPRDARFTPREAEIVGLIVSGLSNDAIAAHCCLSINSIKTHMRAAYRKMGVRTRVQAVLWGIDHGYRSPSLLRAGDG